MTDHQQNIELITAERFSQIEIHLAKQDESYKNILNRLDSVENKMDKFFSDFGVRIRSLEDWRLIFVAKYTAYSTIALFMGSFIAQILIRYFDKLT